jgi:peptidoglycan hydrolase CwlO-like protein
MKKDKLLLIAFQIVLTALLSLSVFFLKDMKQDIREIRITQGAILQNYGDDISDLQKELAKVQTRIEDIKSFR